VITEPTVLVLGAGASMPYGFPSGKELRKKICEKQDNLIELMGPSPSSKDHIKEFVNAFRRSGTPSIDSFLEYRQEFIPIGKLAIAHALIPSEIGANLFKLEDPKNEYWYEYIFNEMNTNFEEFGNNKISFITFNYDRSLEYYLFNVLKNKYGKTEKDVEEKLIEMEVVHLHGQLGYLPWQDRDDKNKRAYDSSLNKETIEIAAEEIRIIHDEIDVNTDKQFIMAHKILNEATRIFFLGFGYNQTNLQRLKIHEMNDVGKILAGTRKGITDNEARQISRNVNGKIKDKNFKDIDIISLFRNIHLLSD
jgi:hypothetical protein